MFDDILTQKISGKEKRDANFLTLDMRAYILYAMTHRSDKNKNREIKCEKCGSYENLEFHHNKYYPADDVTIDDITLQCIPCHRNDRKSTSNLRTVFKDGVRFCENTYFEFEY